MIKFFKSIFGLGGVSAFTLGWDSPLSAWGKKRQLEQYKRYIYTIVSAIAEDVAKTQLVIKRNDNEVPNHPLAQLMRRPNPDSSQFQFLELHQTFMELAGESFWYLVFPNQVTIKPSEMYLIRPDLMEVAVGDNEKGLVTGYAMRKPDGTKITFEKNEIIHHKLPNPLNPYRGMGPVEAAHWYIQTEEFAADWTKNALYNSGRPSGIINLKGTIKDDEFQQMKKRFKQEYAGTANAGKTMFLRANQGVDYVKVGMELGEVAMKELKDMTRDDLMVMWRISKTMLGIVDDVNRANARESRAVWLQNVIQPKVWRLIDQLDSNLVQRYGDFKLDFKSNIPADHAEAREDFKAGLLTVNEAREVIGEADVKDGDTRFMPVNMLPVGNKSKANAAKKKDLETERKYAFWKDIFVRQEAWEKKYQQSVNEVFNEQKKEILDHNQKAFPQWQFNPKKSKASFVSILFPVTSALMKEQAEAALQFAGDPDTAFTISHRVQRFINDRIEKFATDTDEETLTAIQASITEGVLNGDSNDKLRKRIEAIYAEATTVRSQRIARTETIAASNEAALEAYKQSPVVTKKEWLAEPNACEFCLALNGEVLGLDTDYAIVGQTITGEDGGTLPVTYDDISAPPGHPNCRCTILPVSSIKLSK